jgi:hypothetical protein
MARTLTATQQTNVDAAATRPIYIIEWTHSGSTEYLSVTGDITYGGQAYTQGGVNISQIIDSDVATLTMPATSTRITEVQDATWRQGTCVIRTILGAPGDSGTYTASPDQALVIMDGNIQSSRLNGEVITVTVKNKYFAGALCPRLRLDQVANHIPPVGTTFDWGSSQVSYEQWIKTTSDIQKITRPGITPSVQGRQSAGQINHATDPNQSTGYRPISGEGVYLPIVYGRTAVGGYVFADPGTEFLGNRIMGIAWCLGEVHSIEEIYVGDTPLSSIANCGYVNYRGTTIQQPDYWLSQLIAGYDDDMIYHFGGGDVGVCYSVVSVPTSAIANAPSFRAVIKGRLVTDPSISPQSTDPYSDNVQLDVDFTVGTTDTSQNAHTITLNGDAGISSPSTGLELDGTGDYASIADDASLEIGSNQFTLEIEGSTTTGSTSPQPTECLISHYTTDSPGTRSLMINRVGATFYLYLSSNGLDWDISNGLTCGTLASPDTTTFRLVLERVGSVYLVYFNGAQTRFKGLSSASPTLSPNATGLFDSGAGWQIGAYNGGDEWTGTIKSVRLTIGNHRYGGEHSITNSPYSDSGTYGNKVYSNNPALAWSDLVQDNYSGLGGTVTNVATAAAYCDGSMGGSPQVPRAQIGIALKVTQQVTQWLDTLATYANCLYFPEGSDLKTPEHHSVTKWVRSSLTINPIEQEQTPNMVTVTWNEPVDDSAAWEKKTYTVATAGAAAE